MPPVSGPLASPAGAAGRTVAAGTARLFAAWSKGSPLPEAADRRCEGVADLAARRAHVSQSLFLTDRATAALMELGDGDPGLRESVEHSEMIYDGANAYIRVADSWTGFFLVDPGGPCGVNDPLRPLDALFGANDDAVEIGPEAVRGVPATRYRLTVDLARADAALRRVAGQQSCLLEDGPCPFGMAAAGDDVIAGHDERLRGGEVPPAAPAAVARAVVSRPVTRSTRRRPEPAISRFSTGKPSSESR